MLRNRSRAVTGKQSLMADHTSQSSSSSSSSYAKPLQNSFFGSPRFRAFAAMGFSETPSSMDHSLISPTSVLDSKPFFSLQNPFSYNPKQKPNNSPKSIQKNSEPKKPIGLALIEDKNDSKPSKSVIFSAKLGVQIPPPPPLPESAVDGGGKRSEDLIFGNGLMTVKEMEVCEEYTCVRTHGPNPKITHIFDNFVVKSFVDCDSQKYMGPLKKKDFLSFCYTCKIDLQLTNDIYIYRGEKAFCSHECRNQEMLLDEDDDSS